MGGTIRTQRAGGVGTLVFDHPERRNAISREMWRQIPEAAAELGRDASVRVVVLRGAGDVAFVSGADISEFESERTGAAAQEYEAENDRAFAALTHLPQPVIAAIHGFCVGGGLALALTADLRYAAQDARFGIPAARLGVGYSADGVEKLVRCIGRAAAMELLFTGERFAADWALRTGLVNAVLPKTELDAQVQRTAEQIASNAPLTLRALKLCAHQTTPAPAERDATARASAVRACLESEDYREGVRAFLEKRPPRFRGH